VSEGIRIATSDDVAIARAEARRFAAGLGLPTVEQIRLAAPVALLASLLLDEGLTGCITLSTEIEEPDGHLIVAIGEIERPGGSGGLPDIGPELSSALEAAAGFEIQVGRQDLTFRRPLPAPLTELPPVALSHQTPPQLVRQQRDDLMVLLEELSWREEQIAELNREVEDTNRGVLALYEELEDRAETLRRLNELQRKFLSHMTHEFRTPLTAIQSLSDMLLGGLDGELAPEQVRQVSFIKQAAVDVTALVDDLLDLAKAQAGEQRLSLTTFDVARVFGALRGLMRPLSRPGVRLAITDPAGPIPMTQDESKLSQILRNLVSNALKFTEQGEVRVSAERADGGVAFCVVDTGIGIASEDQRRIFEEFAQVDMPLQTKVKGTGLGLPLSRRLAELLGGTLGVESTVGRGSQFTLVIPEVHPQTRP